MVVDFFHDQIPTIKCAGREDQTCGRLLTRWYMHLTELARPASKTFKSMKYMGTFSSETSANRHNSGKFEILIALQNDLRWLLLHSWFSKFPRGWFPGPPYKKRYTGEFWISFFYPTSAPWCYLHPLSSAHTDTKNLSFARHLITPGKQSTCTPPAYYRRASWPVPVD